MTLNVIDLVDGNAYEPGADGYIIKAGQGQLEYNWRYLAGRAAADGKPWGLYWLVDARYSPDSHKAAIKAAFPTGNFGKLGLWLDIEKPYRVRNADGSYRSLTDAEYNALPYHGWRTVESVWRGVQAYTGNYPGWYFGPNSWDVCLAGIPATLQHEIAVECECWIAHYGAVQPSMRGMWPRWALWQWREGPDYNRVNAEWWAGLDIRPEAYVIERALSEYDLCFTIGDGELPLDDAVSHAAARGWEAAMNGGAGFTYIDATHAVPKTAGFATVNGIPYARKLLTAGIINGNLDINYRAPWCVLAFRNNHAALIVSRGTEGLDGMTQAQAALWVAERGYQDAYLMDSGRSAQIEEAGVMLYWPYGPSEKVPQFIGFKKRPTGGTTMKGTAKAGTTTNVKRISDSAILTTLTAGDYVYAPLNPTGTDLVGFDHVNRASGARVDLGAPCKCVVQNLTLTNESEPATPPPPVDPTGNVTLKSWHFVINIDGVDYPFGSDVP